MSIITIHAAKDWDMADSYGLIACQLARHLTRLGMHVNAVGLGETMVDSQPADIRAITSKPILPYWGGIVLGYPTNYHHYSSLLHVGPKIALTMFESTKLPKGWVEPLNEMNAVIVPSQFCATVFRANGVTVPIHVVPLGISEVFQYVERSKDRPLTFLAFLDRGLRKGGLDAMRAFVRAFGEDTNYRLILKSRSSKRPLNFGNPNIHTIHEDMSEQELASLYAQCDVLINPHKGEGFGMIPREFAATGGISLTTNWSGTVDGLGMWGWPLAHSLEKAHWSDHANLAGQELGEWATVDIDEVAKRLRQVANNIDTFRIMARQHAVNVQRMYQWSHCAERVLNIWNGVVSEFTNAHATRQPTLHAEPVG